MEVDPAGLGVPGLRSYRADLLAQEARVSYWRHLILARMDQLALGRPPAVTAATVAPLLRKLGEVPSRGARIRAVAPSQSEHPMPRDLVRLWARVVDPADTAEIERVREAFGLLERGLSAERAHLHRLIDAATEELIRRYREDPMRALEVLPESR